MPIQAFAFCLTAKQQQTFNSYFSQAQKQCLYLCGVDYLATVRRLGLITFRVAMILTKLRILKTASPPPSCGEDEGRGVFICEDTDFNTALELVKILMQHAVKRYEDLPAETATPKQPNQKQLFLETLPPECSRQDLPNSCQTPQYSRQDRRKIHRKIYTKRFHQPLCTRYIQKTVKSV